MWADSAETSAEPGCAEEMALDIPEHVPSECVWDGDFEGFLGELDEPYRAAARLHDGPEIIWATNALRGNPAWIFTRHDVISEGYADYSRFSNLRGKAIGAVMDPGWLFLPLEADPPEHHEYRQILQPFFTPSAIARRGAEVQAQSDRLISTFFDRGSCEFVSEYAAIMPNAIFVSVMGMPPQMLAQFLAWEEQAIHGETDEDCLAARGAIMDYLSQFIAEQRRNPTSEIMQGILSGRIKDRPLSDAEIIGTCNLLFLAGLDTVFSSMGWIMRHLAMDHALQDRLRSNPKDIPAAVNEFTRAFGVSSPTRVVAKDMVYRGVPMKRGEDILLPTFLAGRDPRAWPNPHVIDIERKSRHITFGIGPHVCLGIHLAKRELQVMIESFLARMGNIRIADGDSFQFHTHGGIIGVDKLQLVWDRP
jgi:cytochrome P450